MATLQDNTYYTLTNVASHTVVDLKDGNTHRGTKMQGWSLSSQDIANQSWLITRAPQPGSVTWYRLENDKSKLYMDLDGGHSANGTLIHGWTENPIHNDPKTHKSANPETQLWRFEAVRIDDQRMGYRIWCKASNTVLDLENGSPTNGAKLQAWSGSSRFNPNQIWLLTRI